MVHRDREHVSYLYALLMAATSCSALSCNGLEELTREGPNSELSLCFSAVVGPTTERVNLLSLSLNLPITTHNYCYAVCFDCCLLWAEV